MRRKNIRVKLSTLDNILHCFSDTEEFEDFAVHLAETIEEILFTNQLIRRNLADQEYINIMTMKQIFMLGLFFKDHIEVMREIISCVDYDELSDEEMQEQYEKEQHETDD